MSDANSKIESQPAETTAQVTAETIGATGSVPIRSPKMTRARKWIGVSAFVVAIIAVSLSLLFQYRPAEGTGMEIYADDFIKESVPPFDETKVSHSEQDELDMIHESFDWAIDQLKANDVKVGQGNFGNAMFNFCHDESYQKCEEQNAQFMHLSSYYLNMRSYQLEHFRIGLAFDSKWIIEDALPLKKHVWGIVVDRDATTQPNRFSIGDERHY